MDDYPYGGGAGMVLMIEPIAKCNKILQAQRKYDAVVYMTPDETFNQPKDCKSFFAIKAYHLHLCGHYKGVDQRERFVVYN